jgi:nucleotide-binding universal stress UspA family protein
MEGVSIETQAGPRRQLIALNFSMVPSFGDGQRKGTMIMRILGATDGSDAAARAVELAARLTKELRAHLKIVNVVSLRDIPLVQLDEYSRSGHVTRQESMTAESKERLWIARQRVEAFAIPDVLFESAMELHEGNAAETIIDAARRDNTDLIIVGKRGLSRLSGLVLGSVSQKLVEDAPCAVMVVS